MDKYEQAKSVPQNILNSLNKYLELGIRVVNIYHMVYPDDSVFQQSISPTIIPYEEEDYEYDMYVAYSYINDIQSYTCWFRDTDGEFDTVMIELLKNDIINLRSDGYSQYLVLDDVTIESINNFYNMTDEELSLYIKMLNI